jgi:SAM-dependent methyltransferase
MAGLLTKIVSMFPSGLKKKLRRVVYNRLADIITKYNSRARFTNLGCASIEDLPLLEKDKPYRLHFNMYHELIKGVDVDGRNVLEVGCGFGGGGYYLATYRKPANVTCIDLSDKNIARCEKLYDLPNLKFFQMDAENLKFENGIFDIIINLESSHGYPARDTRFCNEVIRLLKPGGYFAYGDLLVESDFLSFTTALTKGGMARLSERDITQSVLSVREQIAMNLNEKPFWMPESVAKDFMVTTDSNTYKAMANGSFPFKLFVFRKGQ